MNELKILKTIGTKTVALILGGGRGTRLYPLTQSRCKPAVSVGGQYRLIDIPISNCINSGINMIYVLTQFLSAGLHRHITKTYRFDSFGNRFVEILAAEQSPTNYDYAQGTADAVRQSLRYLDQLDASYVFILSGDQLYRQDLKEMLEHHLRTKSEVTVAAIPVAPSEIHKYGVMRIDGSARIIDFYEKPDQSDIVERYRLKNSMPPDKPFLASMGLYLFNKSVLFDLLNRIPETDFGKGILPQAIQSHFITAYRFNGYWEDIGTIQSYYEASLKLVDDPPPFSFYDFKMPIYTHQRFLPPCRLIRSQIDHSLVSDGSIVKNSVIIHSSLGIRSFIKPDCSVIDSIILGNDLYPRDFIRIAPEEVDRMPFGIGGGTQIRRAIIDKNVVIGKNSRIIGSKNESINLQPHDRSGFHIANGIIVIPRGMVLPENTVIEADRFDEYSLQTTVQNHPAMVER
ncbi:MAG: glucose-1-phosphate adenylyltransferase [Candidatus Delongbacteria bacterium]|nr:glucose-1-phosphate adenylyltransferase [Candidatus Delongbacteria bacterium]